MGLNLIGKIELDGAGFERGLRRAGDHVGDFVKNATVAAFGFYGVEEAIRKTVETASDLVDASQRLDVTVEQLQLLKQAAKDGGSELGTVAKAFEKIDEARSKALGGDKASLAAFARLGVTQDQLKNQTAGDIFTGSLSNAAKNNSVEDIGPALKEVLGKGFGELLPVLKTDFDELGGKMKALGVIMDTDTAVKLDALGDNLSLLSSIIAVQLGPVLVTLAQILLVSVGKIKEFGAFLGALMNKGPAKGAGAVARSVDETMTSFLPEWLSNFIVSSSTKGRAIMGMGSDEELDEIMTTAGDAANDVSDEWKAMLKKLSDALDKSADELKHPKPRAGSETPDVTTAKGRSLASIPSDALVKVGNFLGSNGNTIERVNQQKIQLLKRIADTNDKIVLNTKSGGGQLGIGIGIPLN